MIDEDEMAIVALYRVVDEWQKPRRVTRLMTVTARDADAMPVTIQCSMFNFGSTPHFFK